MTMFAIMFFRHHFQDTETSRTLYLEAGRATHDSGGEYFCLGNESKRVRLDRDTAADFMDAVRYVYRRVQKGRLEDKDFFACSITDPAEQKTLGIDVGIKLGRPYLAVENSRVSISTHDLGYLDAACSSARYLAQGGGKFGIAHKIAGYGQRLGPTPHDGFVHDEFEHIRRDPTRL